MDLRRNSLIECNTSSGFPLKSIFVSSWVSVTNSSVIKSHQNSYKVEFESFSVDEIREVDAV